MKNAHNDFFFPPPSSPARIPRSMRFSSLRDCKKTKKKKGKKKFWGIFPPSFHFYFLFVYLGTRPEAPKTLEASSKTQTRRKKRKKKKKKAQISAPILHYFCFTGLFFCFVFFCPRDFCCCRRRRSEGGRGMCDLRYQRKGARAALGGLRGLPQEV